MLSSVLLLFSECCKILSFCEDDSSFLKLLHLSSHFGKVWRKKSFQSMKAVGTVLIGICTTTAAKQQWYWYPIWSLFHLPLNNPLNTLELLYQSKSKVTLISQLHRFTSQMHAFNICYHLHIYYCCMLNDLIW